MEICGKIIGYGTGKKRVAYRLCGACIMTLVMIAGVSMPGIDYDKTDSGQNTRAAMNMKHNGAEVFTVNRGFADIITGNRTLIGLPELTLKDSLTESMLNKSIMPNLTADKILPYPPTENAAPALSAMPFIPEVPMISEVPILPELPFIPEVPIVPDVSVVPESPIVPEVPAVPETPALPDVPIVPDIPTVPESPTVPDIPSVPGNPDIPEETVPSPPLDETVPDNPSDNTDGNVSTIPGFRVNDAGMIYKFVPEEMNISDGYLTLPSEGCSGILKGAFDGVGAGISDVEITPNITYIEDGALSGLTELYGIWTDDGNPNYTSPDGVLLDKSETTILSFPSAWIGIYDVPGDVTRIADYAFANTSLSKIMMRKCMTMEIGNAIFGEGDGTGITICVSRNMLTEYQAMFAGYNVNVSDTM